MRKTLLLVCSVTMFVITAAIILLTCYHFHINHYSFDTGQIIFLVMTGVMGFMGSWLYYSTYKHSSEGV